MALSAKVVNPGEETLTVYSPAGSSGTTKLPSAKLITSRVNPVAELFTFIFAPTITAPEGSVTVPRIEPRKLWAPIGRDMQARTARVNMAMAVRLRKLYLSKSLSACTESSLDLFAFARNKDRNWRRNLIGLGKITLVQCEAHAAARVDVKQGLADRHIHEGFHVGKLVRLVGDLDGYIFAYGIAELFEIISLNVCDQAAIGIVEADDFSADSFRVHGRHTGLQPN